MIKEKANNSEIKYVLDNLRLEDKEELIALYGCNWKEKAIESTVNIDVNVIYGLDLNGVQTPISIGGFQEVYSIDSKIACVWLLSTSLVSKNKQLFFSDLKTKFKSEEKKYDIIYNFIYKSNHVAKKWLKRFGFKFDNPKPNGITIRDDFEFFYKVTERNK